MFLFFHVEAQKVVSGFVFNRMNHEPVNFATVYINGTTKGASTDEKGHFAIPNVSAPCQLVVSRVGYEPLFLTLDSISAEAKTIFIREKATMLSAVTVTGISNRKEYVAKFKEEFLGTDSWGKKAILMNEKMLIFTPTIDSVVSISKFSATSNEPIIVDLPLLGYKVFINLISFSFREKSQINTECHYKGAFYYKSYPNPSARQLENRKRAYLNSAKHFLSALYQDLLKENGFLTVRTVYEDTTGKAKFRYDDLTKFCHAKDEAKVQIQGQNKIRITLFYFADSKGRSVDMTKDLNNINVMDMDLSDVVRSFRHYSRKTNSIVYFLADDCTIRSNGTIPEGNIKFFGALSDKRVGAKLPGDYELELTK